MSMHEVTYQDCFARWDGTSLILGNSKIVREFACEDGKLHTVALGIPGGLRFESEEVAAESRITCQESIFDLGGDNGFIDVYICAAAEESPLSETALHVVAEFVGWDDFAARKHFWLWPGVAAIRSVLEIESASDTSNLDYTAPDALSLGWAGQDAQIRAVQLHDLTDYTCELVTERDYSEIGEKPLRLIGNLAMLRSGEGGLFAYKESPVSTSQLYPLYYDFAASASTLDTIGAGFHNLPAGKARRTYASIVGIYEGDWDDAILAFKQYQRARYRMIPERDYLLQSNSWGDFRQEVTAEKILREVEVAAELGLTDVEIDAGWTNQTMGGEPDPVKFPEGFAPIITRARELGIRMGIWTIPTRLSDRLDVLRENPDWVARSNNRTPVDTQRSYYDSNLIGIDLCHPDCLEYVKDYYKGFYNQGFRRFKSDTFQLDQFNTLLGDLYDHYEAFRRLQHELRLECPGLSFDQDVTRANRPTFDFSLDYGAIFVENRYQTWAGNGNYKPYKTLSSLWQLAPYVPPQKLLMELCNDEPGFDASYLFACVMFANPLFWESLAAISEESKAELKPLIALYKEHQRAIFAGHIVRLGERPSGTAWMGLQSHQPDSGEGYLIAFREDNPARSSRFYPKYLRGPVRFESLTDATPSLRLENPAAGLDITLESPFSFRLYRYAPAGG